MIWVFVGIAAIIIIAAVQINNDKQIKAKQSHSLTTIPNFTAGVVYNGGSLGPGLAIDPASAQFAIMPVVGQARVFEFGQLVAVDVVKDGQSLQITNRSSQTFGAAAGGLLLGPVGLLMGGVTGSKRTQEKVKRLSLKITTNDLILPVTEIVFFYNPSGTRPGSILVKTAIEALDQWHGRFRTILARPAQAANISTPPRSKFEAEAIATARRAAFYKVTLLGDGGKKIDVIKAVIETFGLGLTAAKELVESAPVIVASGLSESEAQSIAAHFRSAGGLVELEPVS